MPTETATELELAKRFSDQVIAELKTTFVGKDEIIDLLGVCLVAGENLFILGPPGTAKSALVYELGRRLQGRTFEYLLTRFTEPNEIFGPFDIRKLREGDLVTNTEGMLPEADLVFLDELLNANSAILNSLLTVLNERLFRRGREKRPLPLLMVVGASNHLPEDDALGALFDRFLIRVHCDNVETEHLSEVLQAGWRLDLGLVKVDSQISVDDVRKLSDLLATVDFAAVQDAFVQVIGRLRQAGIAISDRRAVKLQKLVAASALMCGRQTARLSDLWVLRYIWDYEEQQEVLAGIVQDVVDSDQQPNRHPRAAASGQPDPEELARALDHLATRLTDSGAAEQAVFRDRLGVLAARCEWVTDEPQREFLQSKLNAAWDQLDG